MLEEIALDHKELYQASIHNVDIVDFQTQVVVSYKPPLIECHEETQS
jgi:hypothetical protein